MKVVFRTKPQLFQICGIVLHEPNLIEDIRMNERVNTTHLHPWSEPPGFPVVIVITVSHFRANQQNFTIKKGNTAIIGNISMHNWHTNIN